MIVSVEISLYPLQNEYGDAVMEFIEVLHSHNELTIETGVMSTLVSGKYADVMPTLYDAMEATFGSIPASFVLKVSNGCLSQT